MMVILIALVTVGILNSMSMAVQERFREIGTLRAIGMNRRQLTRLFLLEGFSLGFARRSGRHRRRGRLWRGWVWRTASTRGISSARRSRSPGFSDEAALLVVRLSAGTGAGRAGGDSGVNLTRAARRQDGHSRRAGEPRLSIRARYGRQWRTDRACGAQPRSAAEKSPRVGERTPTGSGAAHSPSTPAITPERPIPFGQPRYSTIPQANVGPQASERATAGARADGIEEGSADSALRRPSGGDARARNGTISPQSMVSASDKSLASATHRTGETALGREPWTST